MVDKSPESQVLIGMDATASPPRLPAVVPSNQETTRWKYDVFLSFRGPDTRKGITVDIRDRLQSRGIETFMDDRDLEPGDPISRKLIEAIQESRFAVVVFSQNYAFSTWCLEELAKIWECMANQDRIFPLFYGVDPAEVRYQKKRSFKRAFSKHETSGRHKPEMVKQWRAALQGVANISGWNTDAFKTHRELVDNIVESLRSKVPPNAIESTADFQALPTKTMSTNRIRDIVPGKSNIKIKARVSRMWRGMIFRPVKKADGLDCVLNDEHGDSIHAVVEETDVEDVLRNMKEGYVYEISKFRVKKNRDTHIVVPHIALLAFTNRTVFELITPDIPAIPKYCFSLMDYNDLHKRRDDDTILTDVIGLIREVSQVGEATVKDRLPKIRKLQLQNTRNQQLRATVWGELALNFEVDKIIQMPPPVVIVITSNKVTTFSKKTVVNTSTSSCVFIDPSIPEIQEYKQRFAGPLYAPKLVPYKAASSNIEASDILNISNLILQDPNENKDSSFTCRAKITNIVPRDEGWYYLGCPNCTVKLQMGSKSSNSAQNICPHHGEQVGIPMYKFQIRLEDEDDSTSAMIMCKPAEILIGKPCSQVVNEGNSDKTIVPNIIQNTMHTYKLWTIGFSNRKDFMVRAVRDDTEEIGQAIESVKPPEKLASPKKKIKIAQREHTD